MQMLILLAYENFFMSIHKNSLAVGLLYAVALGVSAAFFISGAAKCYFIITPPELKTRANLKKKDNTNPVTAILDRNIFGIDKVYPAPTVGNAPVESGQPGVVSGSYEMKFPGKMTGILKGRDSRDTRVILLLDSKDVYILGFKQPIEGYELEKLENETATVSFNGIDYLLELQESTVVQTAAASRPPQRSITPNTPAVPAAPPQPTPAEGGTDHINLSRAELMTKMKDVNAVISSMRVTPAYGDDKEFLGYKVSRMQADSPILALGVQVGDVINRINGEELTEPQVLFSLLQRIDEVSAVAVDITRAGAKKTLFVEIQ
jgi:type II secretion system protein C